MPAPAHAMTSTLVHLADVLPLTCTRAGTCCHGKLVWVNPWEVACLARAQGLTVRDLHRTATCDGGIRLRFDGAPGWRGLPACHFYQPGQGCRVHAGRPLACRLYPLGRLRTGGEVRFMHDGPAFPCLEGCPAVTTLPQVTVAEYLSHQDISHGVVAADAYLEVVQDLAEGAFIIALDSGLVASGYQGLLERWRHQAALAHELRAHQLPQGLRESLVAPDLDPGDAAGFVRQHADLLQAQAQAAFGSLTAAEDLAQASVVMLALAVHLAASLGADLAVLMRRWLEVAREQGMR